MNKDKLNKKYENYKINKHGFIIKNDGSKEKICNFYITSVDFITRLGEKIFFKIDYCYDDNENSVIIPYEDYNDPNHWVKYYMSECKILTTTSDFNKAIIEITTNLSKDKKDIEFYKKKFGWIVTRYDEDDSYRRRTYCS